MRTEDSIGTPIYLHERGRMLTLLIYKVMKRTHESLIYTLKFALSLRTLPTEGA